MLPTLSNEDIYEAALDSEALGRLPAMLARACNGRSTVMCWFGAEGAFDVLQHSYFPPEMMRQFSDTFVSHDVWTTTALSKRYKNTIIQGDVEMTDDQFSNSIIFNEFFRKNNDDTFYCVGGSQVTQWGTALIGVHRNRRAGSFDESETARLTGIVKHLRGALTLRGRLSNERRAGEVGRAAWDATTLASIMVRADGRIVQHNEAADAVLRRADAFKVSTNDLRAVSHEHNGRLMRAIRLATASVQPCGSSLRLETEAGAEYLVSVAPISRRSGPSLALILFNDPKIARKPPADRLRQLFALSAAESELALALADGLTPEDIAARRRVSLNTVRSQIRAMLDKMGCRRLSQAAAVIASLPPV